MENNKILFLTINILLYVFLSVFIGKTIMKSLKKTAIEDNNYNYYAIVFSGFILCSGIIGKELITVLNDAYLILQKNNSDTLEYFKTASIFIISGIIISILSYYLSLALMKVIFEKIKIVKQYSSDQFGYFLLLGVFMILLGLMSIPLFHELLISFSPIIKVGLYN